ncbi:hypothetical protein GR7B_00065 [Vibrio phage vB_VcorM_GR7B]|nr:hypothetical protein GR7B_00065 [Vibrio phage vB_VcorM_GR7B]
MKISRKKLNDYLLRTEDRIHTDSKKKRSLTKLDVDDVLNLQGLLNGAAEAQSGLLVPDNQLIVEKEYDELNLIEQLEQVLSSGLVVPPDLRIDDRDIKEHPNFFRWCMSPTGADQAPFARQLELATKMFAEYCPDCTAKRWPSKNPDFGKSFECDRSLPVAMPAKDAPDHIQFLEYGTCPKCKKTKPQLIKEGKLYLATEFAGCVGQRAGKSAFLGLMIPYLIHRYLKLQKPVEVMGLMKNSVLIGTVVGLTFGKAVELLWTPIHNAMRDSYWFREYHGMLDHYAELYGEEDLYKFKDTFVSYPHRSLHLHPSGPNKRTLRGATRIFAAIDELGWFHHGEDDDDKERTSANEVYTSLSNSLMTVRKSSEIRLMNGMNNIPSGYSMNISSPSSYQDKIMTLVRENENNPRIVTFHGATWEYNPLYSGPDDFADEYSKDFKKADRDFGANPPMSENPFLDNPEHLKAACEQGRKNLVGYEYVAHKANNGQAQRYAKITKIKNLYPSLPRGVMAIDAGYSNNSFSLVAGFVQEKGGKLHPTVHTIVEIAPIRHKNVLNYTKIANEIIYPLIEELNIGLFVADRWNSLKLMHDIEEECGIYTEQHSLNAQEFAFIYDHITDEETRCITLPKPEIKYDKVIETDLDGYPHCFGPGNPTTGKAMPVAHLVHQGYTVTENAKGVVDKGPGYTDDNFRALCLFLNYTLDQDYVDMYELLTGDVQKRKIAVGAQGSGNGAVQSGGLGNSKVGAVGSSASAAGGGSLVFTRK